MNSRVAFYRPIENAFLGFDNLFEQMERQLSNSTIDNFPPYNLFRDSDDGYTIEMALAGYSKENVSVEHDKRQSMLSITATAANEKQDEARQTLRIGIARRQVKRNFTISDKLEVESASMADGMLTVKLRQIQKPEENLLRIAVA